MKLDLKTIMAVVIAIASLGGFYYTTQYRLDTLELEIKELKAEDSEIKEWVGRVAKKVNRKKGTK